MEFGSFARAKENDTRRGQILTSLNEDYKHLAAETKAESGLLFGINLESAMKSVESANGLSKKLMFMGPRNQNAGRHFLGPSRGRSRFRTR